MAVRSQSDKVAELRADLQAISRGDRASQSDEGGFKGFERELLGLRDTLRDYRKQIDRLEEERLNVSLVCQRDRTVLIIDTGSC